MGEKAEYRSAIRSKKMIRQAFFELIFEKGIEKVTVTDIVKRADLNRGTFYAHYQDTQAVLEEIENEIINKVLEFLDEYHCKNFFSNPLPILLKFANYLEGDLKLYRLFIISKESEKFLYKLKDIFVNRMKNDIEIPDTIKNDPQFIIQAYFFAGGIANLYQAWFEDKTNQSLDEVSRIISRIIISSSAIFLEKKNNDGTRPYIEL